MFSVAAREIDGDRHRDRVVFSVVAREDRDRGRDSGRDRDRDVDKVVFSVA